MNIPLVSFFTSDTDSTDAATDADTTPEGGRDLPDTGQYHRDLISPTGIYEEASKAKVGTNHVKTFFINGWPDEPTIGFLNDVLMDIPVKNDISVHISPFDSDSITRQLGDEVDRTGAKLEGGGSGGFVSGRQNQKEFQETRAIYNALTDTDTELFDVGMYVTIRGDTEEELSRATEELLKQMRSAPALLKPTPLTHNQLTGMVAASPIADDAVGYKTEMMGGAVGAMMPFSSKSIVETDGVDFGVHAGNDSPVMVNRWARENGYNQLTVGKIGSGKSFSTKLNILRSYASRSDLRLFMLDPVGGFDNMTTALDGEKVTVGGRLGLNPLEIRPTPDHILDRAADMDPYSVKKQNVMDFFEMYFYKRGVELGESRGILEQAIETAYEQKGITREVSTHSNDSPTISDVIRIIEQMAESPATYAGADSQELRTAIERQAARLLNGLTQFGDGGQYENLTGTSDLDIRDNDVTYFDLSQKEGSGDIGLMMQLLFSEVYQIAKETDDKVMFIIDEAHYLMKDAKTLDFLETAVRHSRHLDLSINFVTQTIDEFFAHEQSEAIAQQCSIKLFQRTESGISDNIARTLDLNQSEVNFIRTAQAGSPELGYSEALLGVGSKGYVPMRVVGSDLEESIINYELPAAATQSDAQDESLAEALPTDAAEDPAEPTAAPDESSTDPDEPSESESASSDDESA